jgi:hypothetical protein
MANRYHVPLRRFRSSFDPHPPKEMIVPTKSLKVLIRSVANAVTDYDLSTC